ncbi:hypothetical protein [Paenibacillus sp. CFBP 13594]|uniref:hypothetical protein n=1 Tax=Paenibacillus sp. CFBP 13594 TaxID=2774037 RepID=UPI001A7EA0FF|nr:hypothetical protein [Paenibacillus sp. CFBP 13594]
MKSSGELRPYDISNDCRRKDRNSLKASDSKFVTRISGEPIISDSTICQQGESITTPH